MELAQQTLTRPDTPFGKIIHGDPVRVFDRPVGPSQTLLAGAPLGMLNNGQFVALNATPQSDTLTGDGSATTFDLEAANVDPASVRVNVANVAVYDFTISAGTGTGGVDQIVFGTAPASGSNNTKVAYTLTSGKCVGILLEDCTTAASGAGSTKIKPVVQAGAVVLSALVSPPASWKAGQVIGALILV